MAALLLQGGEICDLDRGPERADLLIRDGTIVQIAPSIPPPAGATIVDATGRVVIPGLVNAHTHSNQALECGLADNLPLDLWMVLASYGGAGASLSARELYVATAVGAVQMLRSGTTAVVDMVRVDWLDFDAQIDAVVQAYRDVGLRAGVAVQYSDLDFFDSLPLHLVGSDPPLPRRPGPRLDRLLAGAERFVARWQGRDPRILPMLGPSSVPRCSDELFAASVDLARRAGCRLQTHLLSAKSQVPLAAQRFRRSTVERLGELGCLGPEFSFAHCIWPTAVEIEALARAGSPVVLNTVSNQKLGAGIAPLQQLRDAGVVLALGTDGASSNDGQNMFDTLKSTALLHKLYGPSSSWPTARQALAMCWQGGAAVLGEPLGALQPGFRADLVLLRLDRLFRLPHPHMLNQLVYGDPTPAVDGVIVHGRPVLERGRVVGLDETALWTEAQQVVDRLFASLPERLHRLALVQPTLERLEQAVRELPLPIERRADVH